MIKLNYSKISVAEPKTLSYCLGEIVLCVSKWEDDAFRSSYESTPNNYCLVEKHSHCLKGSYKNFHASPSTQVIWSCYIFGELQKLLLLLNKHYSNIYSIFLTLFTNKPTIHFISLLPHSHRRLPSRPPLSSGRHRLLSWWVFSVHRASIFTHRYVLKPNYIEGFKFYNMLIKSLVQMWQKRIKNLLPWDVLY